MRNTIKDYIVFAGIRSQTMKFGNDHSDEGISDVRGVLKTAILYDISDATVDSLIEKRKCVMEKRQKRKI